MVAIRKQSKPDYKLPCIGIWMRTNTCSPTAGNTLVGLWLEGGQHIGFFCAFYRNEAGVCVDPDLYEWDSITYHCRQSDQAIVDDPEIARPDYWAEARWLIPGWGDK